MEELLLDTAERRHKPLDDELKHQQLLAASVSPLPYYARSLNQSIGLNLLIWSDLILSIASGKMSKWELLTQKMSIQRSSGRPFGSKDLNYMRCIIFLCALTR